MNWKAFVDFAVARLSERSTWAGLIGLVSAAGYAFGPEQSEAIMVAGMAFAGLLSVLLKEGGDK